MVTAVVILRVRIDEIVQNRVREAIVHEQVNVAAQIRVEVEVDPARYLAGLQRVGQIPL